MASPSVNRRQKGDKDLAQWLPALNQCWHVNRVVQVKRKYNLSMDQAEANTARRVLTSCPSTQIQFTDPGSAPPPQRIRRRRHQGNLARETVRRPTPWA